MGLRSGDIPSLVMGCIFLVVIDKKIKEIINLAPEQLVTHFCLVVYTTVLGRKMD